MTFDQVKILFNRAIAHSFSRTKLILTFTILALSGIMVVFFRGMALDAGDWLRLSLVFVPIFICAGVLLSLGTLLIRIYHDEVKQKPLSYTKIAKNSWDVVIAASYFSVPILLCYLLLWMSLGVFFLLSEIPIVGSFFGVVLSFGPFLLNLGSLVLIVLNLALLFFVAPILALKGGNRIQLSQILVKRFQGDLFTSLFLMMIALFPLIFVVTLLTLAAFLTGSLCIHCETHVQNVMVWFFVMIPFTALLSPVVIFFFNFSAESHIFMQRASAYKA